MTKCPICMLTNGIYVSRQKVIYVSRQSLSVDCQKFSVSVVMNCTKAKEDKSIILVLHKSENSSPYTNMDYPQVHATTPSTKKNKKRNIRIGYKISIQSAIWNMF